MEEEEKIDGESLEVDVSDLEPMVKPGLVGHRWRQRGPYIVCTSCPLEHAFYIGVDKHLVGFDDDGLPRIKKVELR